MPAIQFGKRFCSLLWVSKFIRLKSTDPLSYSGVKLGCSHLTEGHRMRKYGDREIFMQETGERCKKRA